MQGLLDQYMLASNKKGLDMVVWMTDYFSNRVKNLIQNYTIQRHWEAMNEETGGFNDVMYQLYTITVILVSLQLVVFSSILTWIVHLSANFVVLCCSYSIASYSLQKDQKHLTMAHLFDKPCFLGPLGLHVSTWNFSF
jgi:hypothetical protein